MFTIILDITKPYIERKNIAVTFLVPHWRQTSQSAQNSIWLLSKIMHCGHYVTLLHVTFSVLILIIVRCSQMMTQVLISKIHYTLYASQKRDRSIKLILFYRSRSPLMASLSTGGLSSRYFVRSYYYLYAILIFMRTLSS